MLAKRAELAPIPSLRRLVSAGEPIEPEAIRVFRERLGLSIGDGYGQTETGAIAGMAPGEDDPARDGSMGRPLPGIETRVVDGELQLRGPTSETFFDHYLDGGRFDGEWWATGDLVREDEDGYLWFEGRNDDLILSSGYRIGPFEVESALVSHPAVTEAAAVADPDPERGSVVRAIVVLGAGERALRRARARAPGARQSADGALQVPADRRVRRGAAEDDQRQDPPGRAAPQLVCLDDDVRDRPQADRRADRGRAGALPQPHRRLGQNLRAGGQIDAERGPVLVPGQRSLAGLHRPRRGQPGLGRRRQRIRRLPQRVRRDVHRPRQPDGRRGGQGPDRPRHPLRRPDRRLDRRRRGAAAPLRAAAVAVQQLRDRVDDGRRPPRPRRHRPRQDPQDRGLLPRPPRHGDGLGLPAARGARRPRRPGQRPLRRRHAEGDDRTDPLGPLQRRRRARRPCSTRSATRSPG